MWCGNFIIERLLAFRIEKSQVYRLIPEEINQIYKSR